MDKFELLKLKLKARREATAVRREAGQAAKVSDRRGISFSSHVVGGGKVTKRPRGGRRRRR